MKEVLKRWWHGKYEAPPENDPNSRVFIIMPGTYKLHWTSMVVHSVFGFLKQHWQWSIGVAIAVFFGVWKH
jgi:hypothetical protein